ncbi:MAG: MoxR family ATPase [Firmicutes bacterium]|nr:MoxR family ATPase [Bacillota bacterium]
MREKTAAVRQQIGKAIIGKEKTITRVLMAILAGGHILLEDIPGVGKTTLALAFSKAMGLSFNRVQFTPDVVPSDITGFSMYNRQTERFEYKPGAAMCNLLLADELNRTSSKTQSALLEVMQEGSITVDGTTRQMPRPFIVIATQNPLGTAGTQSLPEAQLDRFMLQLSMGYPDFEAQVELLMDRQKKNPLDEIIPAVSKEEVLQMQQEVENLYIDRKIVKYVTKLTELSRKQKLIRLGISPRGALAVCAMARACAYIHQRDYVVPEDVQEIFVDVCRHRLIMEPKAQLNQVTADRMLAEILKTVPEPKLMNENRKKENKR